MGIFGRRPRPTLQMSLSQPMARDHVRIRLVPHIDYGNPSFVFDVIDRKLVDGASLYLGRCGAKDHKSRASTLTFSSYVVSRQHAEIWSRNGKVFVRDRGSSCGTMVNRTRLSFQSDGTSLPYEVRDGDVIQLGIDYQHAHDAKYKAVRIRLEVLDHQHPKGSLCFRRQAFRAIQHHHNTWSKDTIQECCICLYAMAPAQALFVAPCSHVFHFKCLRPLLDQHYPAFCCPLCRTYTDLSASVAVEADQVRAQLDSTTLADDPTNTTLLGSTLHNSPIPFSFLKRPISLSVNALSLSS